MRHYTHTVSDLHDAAVAYADRGFHVFPLKPGTKVPLGGRGHHDATTSATQICKWWRDTPNANIGLNLEASGLIAVDADTYKPECEWPNFISGRDLPDTLVQATARGGTHYIFKADPNAAYRGKLCEGVDIKHKGYIVLEPSVFEGGQYQFQTDDEPAPCPDWVPCDFEQADDAASESNPWTKPNYDSKDFQRVEKLLRERDNELSRDDWIKLGLALKTVFGEDIRSAFLEFSYKWPGVQAGDPESKWESAKPRNKLKLGTVFYLLGAYAELNEDGIARAFSTRYGGTMRFDHDLGRWFQWTGDHWKADTTHLAFSFCRVLAREMSDGCEDSKVRGVVRKATFASGVEKLAQADRAHAVSSEIWDQDVFLLGAPGVTVDLRTGERHKPDPVQGVTKLAAVAPESRPCPLWDRFLNEATDGDQEMIEFLKRWSGYCLTGSTQEHALIFLYGPGGNGKSVFLNTVTRIMGDYATTAAMDTFVSSRGDKHPTELAMLRGARMVSASETEEGRAWAEARIKQMTGGDPVTARFMRQDFFTYQPQFKLTIVGNHAPALANVDDAAKRRFNIVPFTVTPKNPDRELEAKLEEEWPAILQWMIEGAIAWRRDGLKRPESVKAATSEYFAGQDLTAQWLEERTRYEPGNTHLFATNVELFESWSSYAKSNGEEPGSAKGLSARLRRHGLRSKSKKIGGKTYRGWVGVEVINLEAESWKKVMNDD